MVTHGIDGVHVHVKNKFYNEKVKLAKLDLAALIHFHTTILPQHSVMKLMMIS
jgi:hypothetical protein